jgi:hypothetical protein
VCGVGWVCGEREAAGPAELRVHKNAKLRRHFRQNCHRITIRPPAVTHVQGRAAADMPVAFAATSGLGGKVLADTQVCRAELSS